MEPRFGSTALGMREIGHQRAHRLHGTVSPTPTMLAAVMEAHARRLAELEPVAGRFFVAALLVKNLVEGRDD